MDEVAAASGLTVRVRGTDGCWQQSTVAAPGPHLLGREATSDVQIPDMRVSRQHAALILHEGAWYVQDRSRSGTFHNSGRIDQVWITEEVHLRLGDPQQGPEIVIAPASQEPAAPERIAIGRDPGSDVVIRELLVSRHHAVAKAGSDGWWLIDQDSDNGTFVNGTRISEHRLADGDVVTIGIRDLLFTGSTMTPVPEAGTALQVQNLGYHLPDGRSLLSGIDLDLRAGTLIAVIGPSGAGKSTFLKVLTGLLRPSTGRVQYGGLDMHRDYAALRSRIGSVPQEDIVHRDLTVRQALEYGAQLRMPATVTGDEIAARVDVVLAELGLAERAGLRVGRLSGGQRKRVSTALELLTEPALLVLDEPTSGLDPDLDEQMMVTLRKIADSGRIVLVVTHSPASLELCDEVLLLAPGGAPAFRGRATALLDSYGTTAWPTVFRKVAADPVAAHATYREHIATEALQSRPRSSRSAPPGTTGSAATGPPEQNTTVPGPDRATMIRQVRTLVARHLRRLLTDRGYGAFIALLPVLLAVLTAVIPGSSGLGVPTDDAPTEPGQILVILIIGAAFMGSATSCREVVGERIILARERAAGLLAGPYVIAKLLVFAAVCFVQSVVLVTVTSWIKPLHTDPLLPLGSGVELTLAVAGTAYASCALSLLLSALVRSNEQVMPLLVSSVMVQLVLSGGLFPLGDRTGLQLLAAFTPARWGYSAAASAIDLRELVPHGAQDTLWTHGPEWYLLALLVLAVQVAVCALLLWWRIRRLDR